MDLDDYNDYTDEELCQRWNFLETQKASVWIETQMDHIENLLQKERGVIAWNSKGEITDRESRE